MIFHPYAIRVWPFSPIPFEAAVGRAGTDLSHLAVLALQALLAGVTRLD